jgi:hypothetical protein
MQPTYHISFYKQITDSTGHSVDAWQGVVDVRAPNEDRAVELGRQRFAELKDVGVWSLRADYATVEKLAPGKHPR